MATTPPPDQPTPDRPSPEQPLPQIVFMSAPVRRTSGVAVASLVLSLVGLVGGWCLCGVPSLLAVIFGHVGAARTRSGEVAGHGMAVAGLVLGYVLIIPTMVVTLMLAYNPSDFLEGPTDFLSGLLS